MKESDLIKGRCYYFHNYNRNPNNSYIFKYEGDLTNCMFVCIDEKQKYFFKKWCRFI